MNELPKSKKQLFICKKSVEGFRIFNVKAIMEGIFFQ